MNPTTTSRFTLLLVYAALLVLLVLTAVASKLPAGAWSLPIALGIATAKLALIFWFFMQLRAQRGLVRIAALGGFVWLAVLLLLAFADYYTR